MLISRHPGTAFRKAWANDVSSGSPLQAQSRSDCRRVMSPCASTARSNVGTSTRRVTLYRPSRADKATGSVALSSGAMTNGMPAHSGPSISA